MHLCCGGYYHGHQCPRCGYCPCCGRGGFNHWVYQPNPLIWPQPCRVIEVGVPGTSGHMKINVNVNLNHQLAPGSATAASNRLAGAAA